MHVQTILDDLHDAGIVVQLHNGNLIAGPTSAITPEHRALIAAHRDDVISLLAEVVDLSHTTPAVLYPDKIVMCRSCAHVDERHGRRPDGYCNHHKVETWLRVPFDCGAYQTATRSPPASSYPRGNP